MWTWSKHGVEIREWLNRWELVLENEDHANRVKLLIDGQNFVFFFLHNGTVFGGPENSRLTFATIKTPGDDDQAVEDMNFSATNLLLALAGTPTEHIFYHKDIDNIDVISDKEKLFDMLMHGVKSKGGKKDTHELVSKMNQHRKHQKDKEKHDKDGVSMQLQRDVD